ncbi:efflux RND transporter permease subunit [Vibrio lentus]|uniref:efflux RND transporter permease subunit n=1 Tax=Vibrio lentus TaxID=136468 RepID=UPI0039A6CF97
MRESASLLVDNAIVVLVTAYKAQGQKLLQRLKAVKSGRAIFASTLTTLAVFVPLVFVDGIAGALFSDQALTVTFALLASLFVALTAIPMLASRQGFKHYPSKKYSGSSASIKKLKHCIILN